MTDEIHVDICLTEYAKCQRCWKHSIEVGKLYKWPDLCYRCSDAMDSLEETNPELYKRFADQMVNHPMRVCADSNLDLKRLVSDDGKTLEVWFPKEMMTWAEFAKGND